jgi:hypothetical protein
MMSQTFSDSLHPLRASSYDLDHQMNALILNGAKDNGADSILNPLQSALEGRGWVCEVFQPSRMNLRPCTGCFQCWTRTPGVCAQADDSESILRARAHCDLMALISPIRWGSYSPDLKAALERSIPVLLPFFEFHQGEIHHKMRYLGHPRFLAFGISPAPGNENEAVFRRLVARNLLNFRSAQSAVKVLDQSRPEKHAGQVLAALEEIEILS